MSDFAAAINHALGVEEKPAHKPASMPTRASRPAGEATSEFTKVYGPASRDVGEVHDEAYKGFLFRVREKGVTTLSSFPGKWGYWMIFFYTDEELKAENARGNLEGRAQAARNAIDRYLAGKPVFVGSWWSRNLTP